MNERILIVEDEILLAEAVKLDLEKLGYLVVGISSNYDDAIAKVRAYKPELILLDILLNGNKSGIELANSLNHQFGIPFVFLSSNTDDIILSKAAKENPMSYLLKPININHLKTTLKIIFAQNKKSDNRFLFVKNGHFKVKINIDTLIYLQSSHPYTILYSIDKKFTIRDSMQNILDMLPKDEFIKIHKSYAVNKSKVVECTSSKITLNDILHLPVGRLYKKEVMEFIH